MCIGQGKGQGSRLLCTLIAPGRLSGNHKLGQLRPPHFWTRKLGDMRDLYARNLTKAPTPKRAALDFVVVVALWTGTKAFDESLLERVMCMVCSIDDLVSHHIAPACVLLHGSNGRRLKFVSRRYRIPPW